MTAVGSASDIPIAPSHTGTASVLALSAAAPLPLALPFVPALVPAAVIRRSRITTIRWLGAQGAGTVPRHARNPGDDQEPTSVCAASEHRSRPAAGEQRVTHRARGKFGF